METVHATQTQMDTDSCETTPNTTSCVSASPDVRKAPAEAPQPTKAAKKRAKKANKDALAKVTDGLKDMKAVPLNGTALAEAKAVDEAEARKAVIKGVQADAAYIAARLEKYTECVIAEDEAKQKRIVFAETFRDPEVRKRCQNVRDFFATKKAHEFLLGKDGATQYFTAPEYFRNEAGVTYEYIRRLDIRFKPVMPLLTDGTARPTQPRPRQHRLSAGDSPSGKVNVDELPEDARAKVLAAINGTPSESPKETPIEIPDVPPLTMNVRDRVQLAFSFAITCAKLLSPSEKEEFLDTLVGMLEDEMQPEMQMQETGALVEATA